MSMTSSSAVSINIINHVPATHPTPHSYKRLNWGPNSITYRNKMRKSEDMGSALKSLHSKKSQVFIQKHTQGKLLKVKKTFGYLQSIIFSPKNDFLFGYNTNWDSIDYWSYIINRSFFTWKKPKTVSRSTAEVQTPVLSFTSCPWEVTEPLYHVTTERQDSTLSDGTPLDYLLQSKRLQLSHHLHQTPLLLC